MHGSRNSSSPDWYSSKQSSHSAGHWPRLCWPCRSLQYTSRGSWLSMCAFLLCSIASRSKFFSPSAASNAPCVAGGQPNSSWALPDDHRERERRPWPNRRCCSCCCRHRGQIMRPPGISPAAEIASHRPHMSPTGCGVIAWCSRAARAGSSPPE